MGFTWSGIPGSYSLIPINFLLLQCRKTSYKRFIRTKNTSQVSKTTTMIDYKIKQENTRMLGFSSVLLIFTSSPPSSIDSLQVVFKQASLFCFAVYSMPMDSTISSWMFLQSIQLSA